MKTPTSFKPFDHRSSLRIYTRNRPHWRQAGCTYFITTQLDDAIPVQVVEEWNRERERWLAVHHLHDGLSPEEWREAYDRVSRTERDRFERAQAKKLFARLDECRGSCVLKQPDCADVVKSAYQHFDGERLQCGDFVVMPNHVHWLVMPLAGFELEEIMKSINRFSAIRINQMTKQGGRLWRKEPYDRLVRDREELYRIRQYIEQNAAKAGLKEGEYLYHRAAWLD